MSDADRKDVIAALTDVGGAVMSLIPTMPTLIGGTALGLTATGLMTSADIDRGDGSVLRTGVSAGMDLLGALPVVGTTAKFAKIGKFFAKKPKL